MLPETDHAREGYIAARDAKNRWREWRMNSISGDLDAFQAYIMDDLASEAETPWLREVADFAEREEMLTPEMLEAVQSIEAWGNRLRDLCRGSLQQVAA